MIMIAIEGLDGSGKTTQARLLAAHLQGRGKSVVLVEEPGTTATGEAIREILLDGEKEIGPLCELFLYEASRAQLVREVVRPALAAGKIVVADRFSLSSLAYQGYGRGLPLELVETLNGIATDNLVPDLTLLLDIPPEEGLRRKGRSHHDRMESAELQFYRRVRQGYLSALPAPPQGQVIDGHQSPQEVLHRIRTVVEGLDI